MTTGRVRSLRVQASQTVDLSFNMPGIIEHQNFDHSSRNGPAFLGERVNQFDIRSEVYSKLHEVLSGGTTEGRPRYDSNEIRSVLLDNGNGPYLFSLRNESLAAQLDQIIGLCRHTGRGVAPRCGSRGTCVAGV